MSSPSARELEQIKLTATWLNTIGAGSVVIGTVTPLALTARAMEQAGAATLQPGDAWVIAGAVFWLPMGVLIHAYARRFLRRWGV